MLKNFFILTFILMISISFVSVSYAIDFSEGGSNGGNDGSEDSSNSGTNGGDDGSEGGSNGGNDGSEAGTNGGNDGSEGGSNGGNDGSEGGSNGGNDGSEGPIVVIEQQPIQPPVQPPVIPQVQPPIEPPIVVIQNTAPSLNVPDQNVNEDSGFLNNLIDLWNHAADDVTSVANLIFTFVAQTAPNIISCTLDSGRFIDCTAQANQNGFSDVTVGVTDGNGLTTFDTFRINVNGANDAPTVDITEPGNKVTEDVAFDFKAATGDIDGDVLTYVINFGDGKTKSGTAVNNQIETTHTYTVKGKYTIKVTVSDGSLTAQDSVTVSTEEAQPLEIKDVVHIGSISFDRESVKPGDELLMFVNFENQGALELNDVRLTAIIQELGIRSPTAKTVVRHNKGDFKTLILDIPKDAKPGRYDVELVVDTDGDRRIKFRTIDII